MSLSGPAPRTHGSPASAGAHRRDIPHGHPHWPFFTTSSNLSFALRTSIAAVAALFLAMWLQLDVPRWAAFTVMVVSPPLRGDTLRKTAARLVGTTAGCVAGLAMTALFPQDRIGFAIVFSVWLGVCAYWATVRQGYASYGASLAAFTAAVVVAGVSSAPEHVWHAAIDRGSATVLGTVCAFFASEIAARSDDVPGDFANRIRFLASDVMDWAADQVRPGGPRVAMDAPFTPMILALNDARMNAIAERPAIGRVRAWVVGLPTALLALQSESLSLRDRAARGRVTDESMRRAEALLRDTAGFLRSDAAVDPERLRERRESLPPAEGTGNAQSTEHRTIIDVISYLYSALEALLCLRRPAGASPTYPGPVFEDRTKLAITNLTRTIVGMAAAFVVWDLAAWPHGPDFLVYVAVVLVLFVRMDDPVGANMANIWGTLLGATIGLVAKYAILVRTNEPVVLAGVVFASMFLLACLSARPGRLALGLFAINAFFFALSPENPQTYDFANDANILLAIMLGSAFASAIFFLIGAPLAGPPRVLDMFRRMRRLRRRAHAGMSRTERFSWETRMYDEFQRLRAATDDPTQRALGARLLLSGLVASDATDDRAHSPG